jgi:hypothetical protein
MVCSCRSVGAAGCGELPSTLVDLSRAQSGLALTTTSAFDVGGRTRRLVIGEILTPKVGSPNALDVVPGPVPICWRPVVFGRTVL